MKRHWNITLGVDVYIQKDTHKALKHSLNQQNAETLHQKNIYDATIAKLKWSSKRMAKLT